MTPQGIDDLLSLVLLLHGQWRRRCKVHEANAPLLRPEGRRLDDRPQQPEVPRPCLCLELPENRVLEGQGTSADPLADGSQQGAGQERQLLQAVAQRREMKVERKQPQIERRRDRTPPVQRFQRLARREHDPDIQWPRSQAADRPQPPHFEHLEQGLLHRQAHPLDVLHDEHPAVHGMQQADALPGDAVDARDRAEELDRHVAAALVIATHEEDRLRSARAYLVHDRGDVGLAGPFFSGDRHVDVLARCTCDLGVQRADGSGRGHQPRRHLHRRRSAAAVPGVGNGLELRDAVLDRLAERRLVDRGAADIAVGPHQVAEGHHLQRVGNGRTAAKYEGAGQFLAGHRRQRTHQPGCDLELMLIRRRSQPQTGVEHDANEIRRRREHFRQIVVSGSVGERRKARLLRRGKELDFARESRSRRLQRRAVGAGHLRGGREVADAVKACRLGLGYELIEIGVRIGRGHAQEDRQCGGRQDLGAAEVLNHFVAVAQRKVACAGRSAHHPVAPDIAQQNEVRAAMARGMGRQTGSDRGADDQRLTRSKVYVTLLEELLDR